MRKAIIGVAAVSAVVGLGVVGRRMVLQHHPGKADLGMHGVDGPAEPGDLVALTVLGVAEVRVAAGQGIAGGQRLTLSSAAGQVRALRAEMVDGTPMVEAAATVGIALGPVDPQRGTVPVFVSPR